MEDDLPLLVFSHLRWGFVYQRPQHVISRLAKDRDVLFIEEPVIEPGEPRLDIGAARGRLRVIRPHLPQSGPAFGAEQQPTLERLLRQQLDREGIRDWLAWLYTPMAYPLAMALGPRAVVYDCMDELSAFLGAPPELVARERELLSGAAAVLCGGPSLYRSKKDRHPFVHCLPSSVDVAHFACARTAEEPAIQAPLRHPRLGYYGVIDERVDLELVDALAQRKPGWQIVLVGPVVKIDPARLPRRDNVHYFGQQEYDDLPAFLAGWHVCLMPFAINAATRFISPTKVLEYMAAERPIVSTPITDVAEPYGDFVEIADGPDRFVAACERLLTDPPAERERRLEAARQVLRTTSWDATVGRMNDILRAVADSIQPAESPRATQEADA